MACQTNITEANSGTLYYHYEFLNATSADNKCISSEQGRLAILDTEEKFRDAIEKAPQNVCKRNYYIIGLMKNGSDFVWLNGVKNRLAFNMEQVFSGQCGWISPDRSRYKYKNPGDVITAGCEHPAAFLCFKPPLINNEMYFSTRPDSAYSTNSPITSNMGLPGSTGSSPRNMGLPGSTGRTSGSGLLIGGIGAVAVLFLVIAGILAYMKYKKGQFASGSTKIEIENSLYGKIEDHRTHNVRTMPEDEEIDVSPYGVTTIQQDPFNEALTESRSSIDNLTSGIELCDVSPCAITTITTIQQANPRDNSTTVAQIPTIEWQSFEENQVDMRQLEPRDQKPQCLVVPLATGLGETVVYSHVNKSKSA